MANCNTMVFYLLVYSIVINNFGESMAKRKKSTLSNSSTILTYIAWTLALTAILLSTLATGYYLGYADAKQDAQKKEKLKNEKRVAMLKRVEEATRHTQATVNERLKQVLKKEDARSQLPKHEVLTNQLTQGDGASHEYDDTSPSKPPPSLHRDFIKVSAKPKLAIIIDDMSLQSQVNAIKALGIPLTMSFLPPRAARPDSAKLASKENFYMVHLPMGAQNFSHEEPLTLHADDSQSVISLRIKELKRVFPRVEYMNNHTGSRYTSDEKAMNRLIFALKNEGINFIDSRTTSETQAEKVMTNFGLKYVARDVFLDHHMDKAYIKTQIKKAIKIAKVHGTAIAIGHPHANTILALSESKQLFKDVDLVYINKLY